VFLYAGGESRDPEEVAHRLAEEAARLAREGIDEGLWNRLKKAAYGSRVRALNSCENICVGQAQNFFAGADALAFPEAFDQVTKRDAEQLLERWVTPVRTTLSVVRPREGA
jgi:predicted Zn-dependent peptidase